GHHPVGGLKIETPRRGMYGWPFVFVLRDQHAALLEHELPVPGVVKLRSRRELAHGRAEAHTLGARERGQAWSGSGWRHGCASGGAKRKAKSAASRPGVHGRSPHFWPQLSLNGAAVLPGSPGT